MRIIYTVETTGRPEQALPGGQSTPQESSYAMAPDRIEVYLRSIALPSRLAEFKDSYDFHYELEVHFRDIYHWLRDQGFSKGRIFEPDSAVLLPALELALERLPGRVAVYDLNTFDGRMRGWFAGVWRAPCVRLGKEKHMGPDAARRALQSIQDR